MTLEVEFISSKKGKKRLVWATDLHLDAADQAQTQELIDLILQSNPDAVLIGGDICNGYNALIQLKMMHASIKKPFYFVLGNHDFYYGSIHKTRKMANVLTQEIPEIKYLTGGGIVELSAETALIGHDGWSDGHAGDFLNSTVLLNDYFLIDELKDMSSLDRLHKLNELGQEAAKALEKTLRAALESYPRVILLTHVPPFRQACLYEGKPTNDNWAPHFVGKLTGDALLKVMEHAPEKELLILCGHSHQYADVNILPNLRVLTGASELGVPRIQGLIYVD